MSSDSSNKEIMSSCSHCENDPNEHAEKFRNCDETIETESENSNSESEHSSESSWLQTCDGAHDVEGFPNDVCVGDKATCAQETPGVEIVKRMFSKQKGYSNIQIKQSSNVQLGDVTNIYGPVYVNTVVSMINQQSVTNQIFLEVPDPVKHGELSIIYRGGWLALSPVQERTLLDGPAKFVIISHTVSQAGNDQASNTRLVQSIQRFHMTKRNFNDIGYNFLIGSDGNVYEGLGWSVVGSHTRHYNKFSVGIAFMGYFNEKKPSEAALKQAQVLIQRGLQLGAIDQTYALLGHRQCSETESPGEQLFREIQKWDKWDGSVDTLHPSPLLLN